MADAGGKIRLFVTAPLGPGAELTLGSEQSHYLCTVMRLQPGALVAVFNGRDGEWLAELVAADRRAAHLVARNAGRPQRQPSDLWLLFAPVKKARTDFIVEKATELGVARIQPVFTRHTNAERIRQDRLHAQAVEAAEQCGETYVPAIDEPAKLAALLDGWDPARRLMFCDERRAGLPGVDVLCSAEPGPWAVLVGPEGGFAPEESRRLHSLPFVLPLSLGPRILRADTAVCAALTLWQACLGDWR